MALRRQAAPSAETPSTRSRLSSSPGTSRVPTSALGRALAACQICPRLGLASARAAYLRVAVHGRALGCGGAAFGFGLLSAQRTHGRLLHETDLFAELDVRDILTEAGTHTCSLPTLPLKRLPSLLRPNVLHDVALAGPAALQAAEHDVLLRSRTLQRISSRCNTRPYRRYRLYIGGAVCRAVVRQQRQLRLIRPCFMHVRSPHASRLA